MENNSRATGSAASASWASLYPSVNSRQLLTSEVCVWVIEGNRDPRPRVELNSGGPYEWPSACCEDLILPLVSPQNSWASW